MVGGGGGGGIGEDGGDCDDGCGVCNVMPAAVAVAVEIVVCGLEMAAQWVEDNASADSILPAVTHA